MRLTFLGKVSNPTESPTLYASDQDTYVVQGWKVTDPEITSKLEVPSGETIVEVPSALFDHLINDGVTGTVSAWACPIVHVTSSGNYIVQGEAVSDAETLGQMSIPGHEDCVEVSKAAIKALLEENADGSGHG
ncbi:hypothetical protein QZH56_04980 [Streptomyces olivoreticuli]|uniref:hypothetical protein n=1 Tax=Streptomyces olivoreticuli TaxID=68246 RepID=UPI00265AC2EF|nr:hypothetical protein [Streptomyces olivoreticuli]WKK24978.1 hypothetical protein QZH56_04980 [Streptomyces olivoreticuli]